MNDNADNTQKEIEEEPIQRHGFLWTVVPEGVILSERLESNDVRVYAFLNMRAGIKKETWWGVQTIAEQLRMSEPTVKRSLKRLTDDNWIRRERRIGNSSITHVFEKQEDCINSSYSLDQNRYNIVSPMIQHDISSDTENRDSIKQRKLNREININEQMQESSRIIMSSDIESLEEELGFIKEEQDKPFDTTPDAIKAIQEVAQKYPNRIVGERRPAGQVIADGAMLDYVLKEEYEKAFTVTPTWDRKANKDFLAWLKERPSEQTIAIFAHWWRTNWRGKKGDSPSVNQVMELWPQAFLSNGANKQSRAAETF
jgi:DNA-binding MarR family transcriptional regulator